MPFSSWARLVCPQFLDGTTLIPPAPILVAHPVRDGDADMLSRILGLVQICYVNTAACVSSRTSFLAKELITYFAPRARCLHSPIRMTETLDAFSRSSARSGIVWIVSLPLVARVVPQPCARHPRRIRRELRHRRPPRLPRLHRVRGGHVAAALLCLSPLSFGLCALVSVCCCIFRIPEIAAVIYRPGFVVSAVSWDASEPLVLPVCASRP